MVMYQVRGRIPRKRHTQLWQGERLLTEQVVGVEGFSGASSILYHLDTPVRVKHIGAFRRLQRDEWIPDAHAHHLFDTWTLPEAGDAISGRRLLMWNQDVEIGLCRAAEPMGDFYRNGEADEVIFVHEGGGTVETVLGDLPYVPGDYIVVPRGITYRFRPDDRRPQRYLVFTSPGLIEIPRRYRNEYGQLLEHAPFSNRDVHPPTELRTHDERGEFVVNVRVGGGLQRYVLDHHPFDVVGWDGYLYPYTFNIADFEPIVKKVHAPPPVHQTFEGRNFVICSFCPRPLDWHADSVPIPYSHANLNSEEMIYYVAGTFGSREGVDVGSVTLHPSGVPHGPQPGLAERSLGATSTDELAVMCDTFHPLRLTPLARELDRPGYAHSWSAAPVGDADTSDGAASISE
ncbi:MAG: homogentisate 1,2-dioxygenase [Actinobacteria bacterium]|nr:homogentisate 1,2-dioxygenase [Actinomycetota bacterium]